MLLAGGAFFLYNIIKTMLEAVIPVPDIFWCWKAKSLIEAETKQRHYSYNSSWIMMHVALISVPHN